MTVRAPSAGTASPTLRLVAWETTRRCPLQCIHCRGAARDQRYEGELSTDEAFRMIDGIASFAKPILILTGGEPMFREDIYACARYATDAGLRVVMSPCGQLIDPEHVQRIRESGIARISISIDGAVAKTHDAFRGVPGAFAGTLRGIALLRDNGVPFQVNATICRANIEQLPDLLRLAETLGAVAFHPFFLVPTGRGRAIAHLELSPDEYERALEWIADQAVTAPIEIQPTCAPHYNRIIRRRKNLPREHPAIRRQMGSRGCLGGQEFVFVAYNGIVQPCGFLDMPCGDLRAVGFDFKKLYDESPVFAAIRARKAYRGKCGACEFLETCGGCRARANEVNGDFCGEEPYCAHYPIRLRSDKADG